jgi:hypothetical protein
MRAEPETYFRQDYMIFMMRAEPETYFRQDYMIFMIWRHTHPE